MLTEGVAHVNGWRYIGAMTDKQRLPIYLTPDQSRAVEDKAAKLGVSKNAVVKMALDQFLSPPRTPQRSD